MVTIYANEVAAIQRFRKELISMETNPLIFLFSVPTR